MSNGSCLQDLWQVCLINTLPLLQLCSSFQTDCGWGTESPQSRTRLCTKYCWAAERERHEQAEAACMSWDALRNCSMVTFCPLLSAITTDFIAEIIYKKENSPFFANWCQISSNAFISHSRLYSKIIGVMILMVLKICQGSLLTIKILLFLNDPSLKLHFKLPCESLRTLKVTLFFSLHEETPGPSNRNFIYAVKVWLINVTWCGCTLANTFEMKHPAAKKVLI